MASFHEHCKDCIRELGRPFPEVHRWLDELFPVLGFSVKHREARHHMDGIEDVRRKWGDSAAEAARVHIARDFDGWVPKDSLEVQKWRIDNF